MKHRSDCPWLNHRDIDGCSCAEQAYLASCTPEERAAYDRRLQPGLPPRLDVAQITWAGTRRTV